MASEGSPKAPAELSDLSKDSKEWEVPAVKEKGGKSRSSSDARSAKGQHRGEHREGKGVKAAQAGTKSSAANQKQPAASVSHTEHFRDKWEKFDTGARRQHEHPVVAPKHGEELRLQQARRTAWVKAQTSGATSSFKNCESQFGNYLVPIIPNQFCNKSPTPASPVSSGSAAPSIAGIGGSSFS